VGRVGSAVVPVALLLAVLMGCDSRPEHVDLPSNHGYGLDEALHRLHAVGLRASFPATSTSCGNGLPSVNTQSPRAPARIKRGSVVVLNFEPSPIPSPGVPNYHPRWTYVPQLVGDEYVEASRKMRAIWPCVHVQAAGGTSASRAVIVAQSPRAGTRLPAYGVQLALGLSAHFEVAGGHERRKETSELRVGLIGQLL
jgi:beta-lactam-binding protein with PASTA domain